MPSEHQLQQLQQLLDKQAIYEVLCRYCRGVDRLDKPLVMSCFHPGAIDVHLSLGRLYTGTVEEFFADFDRWRVFDGSMHYIANFLCQVEGDLAVAETYQFSCYWGTPGDDPALNFTNSNRYVDEFRRLDGQWRISRRELLRNFTRRENRPWEFRTEHNQWPPTFQDHRDPAYRAPRDALSAPAGAEHG